MLEEAKRRSKCKEVKPLSELNRRTATTRRQSYCGACNALYLKQHYTQNLQYYVAKQFGWYAYAEEDGRG